MSNLGQIPDDTRDRYAAAAAIVRQLLYRPGIIVLLGTWGSGKTAIGCGMVVEFCQQLRPAMYVQAEEFFLRIKATWKQAIKRTELDVLQDHARARLLVIDALEEWEQRPGAQDEWKSRAMTMLVDRRYGARLPTVLISNDTEETFKARVGESITDRICDRGGFMPCDWPSLRGRIKAA